MRRRLCPDAWIAWLLLVACVPSPAGPERGASTAQAPVLPPHAREGIPERVVLVSTHGLTPAYYGSGGQAPMPTLAALAEDGVAAEVLTPIFPAAIYPAHTSLVSGLPPAHHGIVADRRLGRRGVRGEPFAHASLVRAPTLWQAVSAAGRPVAALDWPASGGAAIAVLLPDVLPRRRGETWLGLLDDRATPRVLELVTAAGGDAPAANVLGPTRDAVLTRVACELLVSEAPPALLLLRWSQSAPALLRFGPGTSQAREAFERLDGELASLLACLQRGERLASTALVIVGDYAPVPVHTAVRANAFLVDAGLISKGPTGALLEWRAITRSNGGSSFVYARDESAAVEARDALRAAAERTRAFRVLSADEMLSLGADPEAWFGLGADPGTVFEDGLATPALAPSAVRAGGGYPDEEARMRAGFVAWGPGFRSGVRVPELSQLDVAPTLAPLLGVKLERAEGRTLVGLLSPSGSRAALRPEEKRRAR